MGISDLLPQLESITIQRPLSFYRGKRAAVDMMCWYISLVQYNNKGYTRVRLCVREI